MKQEQLLVKLYYLLTTADGEIDEKELQLGEKMIFHEGISEDLFHQELEDLKLQAPDLIYRGCVKEMQQLDPKTCIRYMAWLTLIANVDGFMDDREWQFIYKLYHKDLQLTLKEVMDMQKELSLMIRNNRSGGVSYKNSSFCF